MSFTSDDTPMMHGLAAWLDERRNQIAAVLLLLFTRLVLLLAIPLEGLHGYGDFIHFYQVAQIPGWPYLNYWSEFPPIFPFLSTLLYQISQGQQHIYDYLLVFILSLADMGSLWLFWRLARRMHSAYKSAVCIGAYLVVLIIFPYCWWYFDPLAVLCMLLGLSFLLEGKHTRAGLALGIGTLIKFFPALVLVWAWRFLPFKRSALVTAITLGIAAVVYGGLLAVSPDFTLASLRSQSSKGSWETVWALMDGNYQTGNFGPLVERLDASKALLIRGKPALIPPVFPLIAAGGVGLFGLIKSRRASSLAGLSLVSLAWVLFLLASPGWSPQWVLYLIPLILLTLKNRLALLMVGTLALVNLLEWPVLLSRGYFYLLPAPVWLRTLLLAGLAVIFYLQAKSGQMVEDQAR